jgi:3D (Asp-Asp-Asp) domain-containing protein
MSIQKSSTDDISSIRIILLLPLSLFLVFAIESVSGKEEVASVEREVAVLSSYKETEEVISTGSNSFYSEDTITVKSTPVYHRPQVLGTKEVGKESDEVVVKEVLLVEMTGYSSTPEETNCQPFITASGEWVRDGIVAANFLEFGTKIRIPEYFGEKEFVVKDRMNSRYNNGYVDIWFQTKSEAINFGRVSTKIEVIE